jgi:hypothetical protein
MSNRRMRNAAAAATAMVLGLAFNENQVWAGDIVYSQPPLTQDGNSFPSEINGSQRADDWAANTSSTITSLRWWGTTAGSSGTGNFTLRVFGDSGGEPGALVDEFAIGTSFTKVATGLIDLNGRDIFKYDAELDGGFSPTRGATYWINVMNNQGAAGGPQWLWYQGGGGNGTHAFRIGAGSWNSARSDMSFELIAEAPSCVADLDDSGAVNVDDLLIVISSWGTPGGAGDVNGDGLVNVDDLLEVINAWGPCG